MNQKRWFRIVILLIFLVMSGYTLWNHFYHDQVSVTGIPKIGDPAPDFELYNLENQKIKLSGYSGKVVVLNFWGHWCEPCQQEMPTFEKVWNKFKDKGLVIIGVHLGQEAVTVKHFVDQYGITFPIVYDTSDLQTAHAYGIDPIPDTYIIKPDGTIADFRIGGPIDPDWLASTIQNNLP